MPWNYPRIYNPTVPIYRQVVKKKQKRSRLFNKNYQLQIVPRALPVDYYAFHAIQKVHFIITLVSL